MFVTLTKPSPQPVLGSLLKSRGRREPGKCVRNTAKLWHLNMAAPNNGRLKSHEHVVIFGGISFDAVLTQLVDSEMNVQGQKTLQVW